MLPRLRVAVDPCRVSAYLDVVGMIGLWRRAVAEAGGDAGRVGGHADIAESSIMLTMHPELVHAELAAAGSPGDAVGRAARPDSSRRAAKHLPNGIIGDARGLSAAIGERCVDVVAEAIVTDFRAEMD